MSKQHYNRHTTQFWSVLTSNLFVMLWLLVAVLVLLSPVFADGFERGQRGVRDQEATPIYHPQKAVPQKPTSKVDALPEPPRYTPTPDGLPTPKLPNMARLDGPYDEGFQPYTLGKGSTIPIALQSYVSTTSAQVGDAVEGMMQQDYYLGDRVLLSKNTRLFGHISVLEPPIEGRHAIIGVRFDEIELVNGERLPIQGYVKTGHPSHTWGGQLTTGTKAKTVRHAVMGIGDYNQTVWAGPRVMGSHLQFLPGDTWFVILEQPVTVMMPPEDEP